MEQEHSFKASINFNLTELPKCSKCKEGILLPVTDDSRNGSYYLKGWVCNTCGWNVFSKTGVLYETKVIDGEHSSRTQ